MLDRCNAILDIERAAGLQAAEATEASAGVDHGHDGAERRIQALVGDFFVTAEQYDYACGDQKYRVDCPPQADMHHKVEDACLAAELETIADCEALLRVARQTIERHWGPEDWPGAVIHLLDTLGRDLVALDLGDLRRVKLDADGPDPSSSVKIGIARFILGRLAHGEPALDSTRALLERIQAVVAEAEDRAAKCKAAA